MLNQLRLENSRLELADHLNKIYWKDVFWNGSYFIVSCGGVTVSTLRKYIENQDSPGVP